MPKKITIKDLLQAKLELNTAADHFDDAKTNRDTAIEYYDKVKETFYQTYGEGLSHDPKGKTFTIEIATKTRDNRSWKTIADDFKEAVIYEFTNRIEKMLPKKKQTITISKMVTRLEKILKSITDQYPQIIEDNTNTTESTKVEISYDGEKY